MGYTASLFAELHLYGQQAVSGSAQLYANGIDLGWDYQANADVVAFVNSVTGAHDVAQAESIEQSLAAGEASYKSYYWPHRAGHSDLWFNLGQVLDTHVAAIAAAGYKTVISFRDNGEATNRLASDPATGAVDNHEFSDASGNYAVAAEQAAVQAAGLRFFNLPLVSGGTDTWTAAQFALYLPTLQQAEAAGPVLAHCASGYRSAAYVLAYLGSQGGRCTEWALQQAAQMGVVYDSATQSATDKQVVAFLQEVLKC